MIKIQILVGSSAPGTCFGPQLFYVGNELGVEIRLAYLSVVLGTTAKQKLYE